MGRVAGGLRGERPPCDVRVFGEGGLTSFGTVIDHPALISHRSSIEIGLGYNFPPTTSRNFTNKNVFIAKSGFPPLSA
jgi:hypothetical protein